MLDPQLLRDRSVAAVSIATITLGAGMFAVILYLTIFLQGALGLSPLAGGLRLLPATAPVFLAGLDWPPRRNGRRWPAWSGPESRGHPGRCLSCR